MARLTLLGSCAFVKSSCVVVLGIGLCLSGWGRESFGGEKIGFSESAFAEESDDSCAPVDWSDCEENCDPWITARAGALAMHRSSNESHAILWEQATGRPLLSTTDVNPDWAAGAEVDLWLRLTHDWDVELDWFTLGNWSRDYSRDLGGVVALPLGVPLTTADAQSSSELNNYELNLRYRMHDRISLLGGFRYLELNDNFGVQYSDRVSGLGQTAAIAEVNRLYGFQIGAQAAIVQAGPWQLDGWVKAGIFGNQAHSSVDVAFTGFPVVLPSLRAQSSDAAFVGDLGLRASRRFGHHWQVYGGYRVMLLDGVALTSHQIEAVGNFFNTGVASVDTNATPFYHGAELGAIFSF